VGGLSAGSGTFIFAGGAQGAERGRVDNARESGFTGHQRPYRKVQANAHLRGSKDALVGRFDSKPVSVDGVEGECSVHQRAGWWL
jgi:hypothetical protein